MPKLRRAFSNSASEIAMLATWREKGARAAREAVDRQGGRVPTSDRKYAKLGAANVAYTDGYNRELARLRYKAAQPAHTLTEIQAIFDR